MHILYNTHAYKLCNVHVLYILLCIHYIMHMHSNHKNQTLLKFPLEKLTFSFPGNSYYF